MALDFEDAVSDSIIELLDTGLGFNGFSWNMDTFFVQNDLFNAAQTAVVGVPVGTVVSGLDNSLGSADNSIFNFAGTDTISLNRVDAFDFEQAEMGAIWRDGQEVTIEGFLNGVSTGTQLVTLNTSSSQTVQMDDSVFDEVDTVVFTVDVLTGSPSLDPNFQSNDSAQIYIDDMQFLVC